MFSISDIKTRLGCSHTRAREIMLIELPHIDIGGIGSKRPTWRARKRDFERWLEAREHRADVERIREFADKYMR